LRTDQSTPISERPLLVSEYGNHGAEGAGAFVAPVTIVTRDGKKFLWPVKLMDREGYPNCRLRSWIEMEKRLYGS
jgi:hypothetical protein